MHLTNICWLEGCHWITVLWWQILAVENSPCSYFPSSLCGEESSYKTGNLVCYESTGNSQATVLRHQNKCRLFRKNKNHGKIQPLLPSRRRTQCSVGSRMVWCPHVPSPSPCCGLEVFGRGMLPGEGRAIPGARGCSFKTRALPASLSPQRWERWEIPLPGPPQVLNAVMYEAGKWGFNDSWHSSWMHKQIFAGH